MRKAPGGVSAQDAEPGRAGFQNPAGSIAILCLAFAPHLAVLAYALARLLLWPLLWVEGAEKLLGRFPGIAVFDVFQLLIADRDMLRIYSLPLLAIAIFTLFPRIKAGRDYYGGIAMIAVALFAFWASSDLGGLKGYSFGPGTAPRLFSALLALLGVAIALTGLLTDGEPLQQFAFRGPFFVTLAILLFSVAIRPLGLIVSGILTFLVAAMGSEETRWLELIVIGVLLTLFCAFLFPYVLGLPFELKPQFMR